MTGIFPDCGEELRMMRSACNKILHHPLPNIFGKNKEESP